MGTSVAQNLVQTGRRVVLVDVDEETLDRSLAQIQRDVRLSQMLGRSTENFDPSLLTTAVGVKALAEADVVIENITENWALKEAVYAELDEVCPADTVFVAARPNM